MIPTLTDDEIVAIAIDGGTSWPLPLVTVESDYAAITSARRRGIRSLAVRDLIVDAAPVPEIAGIIKTATSAKLWRAAVGVDESGSPLIGTSTYVLEAADGSTVVDLMSGDGTHRLSSSTSADANQLLLALAKNVFNYGFSGEVPGVQLLVGRSDRISWVSVRKGAIAPVQVTNDSVDGGSPSSTWKPDEITRALGE